MLNAHIFRFVFGLVVSTFLSSVSPIASTVVFFVGACVFLKFRIVSFGLCCGALATAIAWGNLPESPISQPDRVTFIGVVIDGPFYYSQGCGYVVEVKRVDGALVQHRALTAAETCDLRSGDELQGFAKRSPFQTELFPGVVSERTRMARRGLAVRMSLVDLERIERHGVTMARVIADSRSRTRDVLKTRGADRFAVAMITGDKSQLTDVDRESLRKAGLSHLLAISGLHFGAIAMWVWVFIGFFVSRSRTVLLSFTKQRATALFGLAAMLFFLFFVGAPVSAVRAFSMLAAYTIALLLWRRISPFVALSYAVGLALIFNPFWIRDIGFQFSVSAVLSILLALHRIRSTRFAESGLARFIAVSFAASLGTWPVSLAHFGTVSIAGPFVNLLIVPIFSMFYFPLLIVATIGALLGAPVEILFEFLRMLGAVSVGTAAELPKSSFWVCGTVAGPGAMFIFIALWIAILGTRLKNVVRAALFASAGFALLILSPPDIETPTIYFIPVGQGDSTLIRFANGRNILVDAGGASLGADPGAKKVVPFLHRLGISKIDTLIVTHNDIDHEGGVEAVQRNLDVVKTVDRIEMLELEPQLRAWQFLDGVSKNDRSIVLEVKEGTQCVLLTGDIEAEAETWLSHRTPCGKILKAPHHGSKTSSTDLFLDTVEPRVAVVSSARFSRFGHPHRAVVQRYRDRGATLLHTEINGLIVVELSEHQTEVRMTSANDGLNQPNEIP